jgi:thiamine monophosphate kinase
VFTIPRENIAQLQKEFPDFTIVGEVLTKEQGIYILKNGRKMEMKKGYDHFAA